MKIEIQRGARSSTLAKAVKAAGLADKWAKTPFASKLAKKNVRAGLNDLQRFQAMVNKRQRSLAIRKKVKVISKKK